MFSYRLISVFSLLSILLSTSSCQKDYETLKKDGLASGIRNDDLFLGVKFNDTRTIFYDNCRQLNQAGTITNGPRNMSALYTLPETISTDPIDLNFYPDFCGGKVCKMRMTFNYQSWAPWARKYHSKELLPHTIKWIENQYKTKLTKMQVEDKKTRMIAIDGNREIRLWLLDEQFVTVHMIDLTATPDPAAPIDSTQQKSPWMK
jgi:hypothetical protein